MTASSQTQALISLSDAGASNGNRWLVRGVDFEVMPGQIVTLIGPNGSGKTTSVQMALGIIKPSEGRVASRKNLRIGYVPQKLAIDHTMPLSVRRLMTLTQPLSNVEIENALTATGIFHLINSEVQNLSGGEFQRALLARAIARKPDLLVLDEPVQGVDHSGTIALYELIKDVRNKTGCGVLLISHDLHVVMAETDVVICLNGHVCCRGTPQAVSASPEYAKLFGTAGMTGLAIYTHKHDHTHLPDGRVQHADGSITEHCHSGDGHHDHDNSDKHAQHHSSPVHREQGTAGHETSHDNHKSGEDGCDHLHHHSADKSAQH